MSRGKYKGALDFDLRGIKNETQPGTMIFYHAEVLSQEMLCAKLTELQEDLDADGLARFGDLNPQGHKGSLTLSGSLSGCLRKMRAKSEFSGH